MAIGAFIPLVFFVVILGSVGVRLVALWQRTRQIPELALGAGLLIVSLSMPLSAVGRLPVTAMEPFGRACFAAGLFAVALGISLTVYFNYYVFRRGSGWARVLLLAISSLLFAAVAYMSVENFQGESIDAIKQAMRPGTITLLATLMLCFEWAGVESLLCHAAQRRQMALGLGDPVVANRFWLWGVASVTSSFLLLVLVACVMTGMTIVREPAPLMAMAATGSIMSASWYLAFFAPERYLRFIRERAPVS
jgi:hypothetical protein